MDSLGHFIWLLWNLPNGSIWSNLISSVVWGIGAAAVAWFIHTRTIRKLEEHHRKMKDLLDPTTPGGITDAINAMQQQGADDGEIHS